MQLSSDPDKYPIEHGIISLVFEMKRLGIFRPCWSCEGHLGSDGALWKRPRVWFYCDSATHVRLLADGISAREMKAKLSTPWQIVVTFSNPENLDTTFSLEPVTWTGDKAKLAALQDDASQIAGALNALMSEQARLLQRQNQATLARVK